MGKHAKTISNHINKYRGKAREIKLDKLTTQQEE